MASVTGIGGLFFKSKNPESLAEWYRDKLGIDRFPQSYDENPWMQAAGPTVFAPFPADTDYFGREQQMWMLNLRVDHLDGMVAQLRAAGIEVEIDSEDYPNGKFARLYDPEGNPVELWEPISPEASA